MISQELFDIIVKVWIGIGLLVFPVLLKISAPYGRHVRPGWGPMIPSRTGWVIMELISLLIFVFLFTIGPNKMTVITSVFVILWMIHYTNRSLIYPFRTHTANKKMPLVIALFAILFNTINGYLNGYYFGFISEGYDVDWISDIRFIAGGILFLFGFIINIYSDNILLSLRKSDSNGYSIPGGGMFRYVSCPNFFGEIIEWAGFALMTWNPASLAFFIWTCVNLIPRGLDHHKWYRREFENYPTNRKAIFPFIL